MQALYDRANALAMISDDQPPPPALVSADLPNTPDPPALTSAGEVPARHDPGGAIARFDMGRLGIRPGLCMCA